MLRVYSYIRYSRNSIFLNRTILWISHPNGIDKFIPSSSRDPSNRRCHIYVSHVGETTFYKVVLANPPCKIYDKPVWLVMQPPGRKVPSYSQRDHFVGSSFYVISLMIYIVICEPIGRKGSNLTTLVETWFVAYLHARIGVAVRKF